MIQAGERLVAGISGGADSICLLFMLLKLREEVSFELTAVHVNHGLRGMEADIDQAFVEKLCGKHGISCRAFREDVEGFGRTHGLSLEEAGRMVRRKCFSAVLEEEGADRIVLAHHLNDNAETLLMNLARGCGLSGLCGMRPVNGKFVRPLLCLERSEIEAWLRKQNISWCEDSSNESDHYTRNRIRHHVMPLLCGQVNEKTISHFGETMKQMQGLRDFVAFQISAAWERCVNTSGNGELFIQKKAWETEHPYLQGELLKECIAKAAGSEKDISQIHVWALRELFEKQTGRSVDLPGGMTAKRDYEGVLLRRKLRGRSAEPSGVYGTGTVDFMCTEGEYDPGKMPIALKIPGKTSVPWANVEICCTILTDKIDFLINHIPQTPYTKWFDYGIIKSNLTVRTRMAGDFIVIDKEGNRQKLKSWFINRKIPAEQRDGILLIAEESEILWIPGYRRSSGGLVKATTKEILQIQVNGGEKDV